MAARARVERVKSHLVEATSEQDLVSRDLSPSEVLEKLGRQVPVSSLSRRPRAETFLPLGVTKAQPRLLERFGGSRKTSDFRMF